MNVPSFPFLGFVALVALALQVLPGLHARRAIMLIANLAFILTFTHDPLALAPFVGLLATGYAAMRLVAVRKSGPLFIAAIVVMLALFVWFKRYAFVPSAALLPQVVFTVGMSYVFFRVLHLIIDAYQETLPDVPGPIAFLDYTLSFTALVSGPIQLYPSYRKSESLRASLDVPDVARAIDRIATGFFKVSIFAPVLLALHDRVYATTGANGGTLDRAVHAALLVLVFPAFLYLNFSGYTDVVIGASRFLRLELPENFNRPFGAEGAIEFWGRWHMTLSTWLKTYLFTPLLAALMHRFPSARSAPYLGVIAFFVTFFFVGVWHGSTAAFLIFGLMTGLGVSANKLFQVVMIERLGRKPYRALCARPLWRSLSRALTYCWFGASLVFFWATQTEIVNLLSALGATGVTLGFGSAIVVAAALLSGLGALSRAPALAWLGDAGAAPSGLARSVRVATLAAVTVSIAVVLSAPAPAIVYRGF